MVFRCHPKTVLLLVQGLLVRDEMSTFACKPYKRYFVMKFRIFLLVLSLFLLGATVVPVLAQQDIILPPESITNDAYQRIMSKGKSQYSKKQYKSALSTFKQALKKYPNKKSEIQLWINKCNARLEEAAQRERERLEASRQAQAAAEQRAREEANLRAREEAEQRAREEAARREREEVEKRQQIINRLIANMVYVEGGTFTMGATMEQGSDAESNEKPTHEVTLSDFYICKYEVTQAEWKAVMGANPSGVKGDELPVENVSWYDCQVFIRKLNELTGKNFRLPTEAEWEYAARGGKKSKSYKYSGSNTADDVAWYKDNYGYLWRPVGQKSANELGLHDMSGGVWEWCQDWYGSYSSSSQVNPTGPTTGDYRILRGGDVSWGAENCRVSNRSFTRPYEKATGNFGLRLAL